MRVQVILILFVLLLSAWRNGVMAEQNPPFDVHRAEYSAVPEELIVEGVVEAIMQATVTSKTAGTIVELNFDVNDFVEEGKVLVRFSGERNVAGLKQAEASVEQAKAVLRAAEANRRKARRDFERFNRVFQELEGAVSPAQIDELKATLDAAKADANRAIAGLEAAYAGVASAKEGTEDLIIRAPYSGYVVKRYVELGETAVVGQALFSGISLERLRIFATIPAHYVETVRREDLARAFVPGADGKSVESGEIKIFPQAEAGTYEFGVRVELPDNSEGFRPGMLVKLAFFLGQARRLLVPAAAVVQRSEVTGVYVTDGDRVMFRQILTGNTYGAGMVEVLSGLSEGEGVALDPVRAGQVLRDMEKGGKS